MAEADSLVRIAVPGGVEGLFTYRVPADLAPLVPGTRVLVPFGRQRVTGLVVEEATSADVDEGRLRDVELRLDAEPSLTEPLLELARFVADHYLCPLGEVLRAMSPSGPTGTLLVEITSAGRLALGGKARAPRQRRVLEALAETDRVSAAGLRRRSGVTGLHAVLRSLQAKGWVALRETIAGGTRAREVAVWSLGAGAGAAAEAALGRSALRRAVHEVLEASEGPLTVAELAEATGRGRDGVRTAIRDLARAGVVVATARRLGRRPAILPGDAGAARRDAARPLSEEQQRALTDASGLVDAAAFDVLLVEGVTGAGKTEIYLRAIAHAVTRDRTALYLVPEIAITPLLLRTLAARFGERVAVLHSGLSAGERHDERDRIRAGEVDVAVGARSAVFAPLARLGLIIVDEEHEGSYKQESAPRYHGRDVAVARGRIEGVPVLLGSATPSLESYRNAVTGRYRLRRLTERAGESVPAEVQIVDMRAELRANPRTGLFSRPLRERLDATLAAGQQAMILLNRRGWADFLLCRECGEPERCAHCAVTLTVHLRERLLVCHYCDLERELPVACRTCAGTFLQNVGEGTEQLEASLRDVLPDVPLARLDRDVARRKGAATRILSDFEAGKTRVLLGTQMIAKGHDFPGVTLVGVLQADRALWLPDFRAGERTFQLLTQVAGRAGRRRERGRVVVQSYTPEHPALRFAAAQDYAPFYEAETEAREALGYPPFAFLVGLVVSGEEQAAAEALADALGTSLREEAAGLARVLGPAPAPLARIRDRWRFQLLVKSRGRKRMRAAVRRALGRTTVPEGLSVDVDVDPQSLL